MVNKENNNILNIATKESYNLINFYDLISRNSRINNPVIFQDSDYHELILNYFNNLSHDDKIKIIKGYIEELNQKEYLKLIQQELFNEENIIKREERKFKSWILKVLSIAGLLFISVLLYTLSAIEVMTNSDMSNTISIIKIIRSIFGLD